MKASNTRILYLAIILFTTGVSSPQNIKKLTLNESINIGLEKSNVLHSSKMNVNYAESKASEVNTYRLPNLSLRS